MDKIKYDIHLGKKKLTVKGRAAWAMVGAALLLIPIITPNASYLMYLICLAEIYVIAVSGLDILFGHCGQISIGHAAFYAIGAYGSAMLHNYMGLPVLISMLLGAILAAAVGAALAYPASKLVGHFLALATFAFGEIIYQLISRSPNNITGNYNGMYSDSLSFFGLDLSNERYFLYFGLLCVIFFLAAKSFLVNSKVGRAFEAIRENSHAANGMGVNVRKYKIIAFAVSAFFTAWAGGMYVHFVKYISPDTFVLKQSVQYLTMLLFGGVASLAGPVVGVVSVMTLIELLRAFQNYQMLIYGILLLLVIVLIPGGLYGAAADVVGALGYRMKSEKEKKEGSADAEN